MKTSFIHALPAIKSIAKSKGLKLKKLSDYKIAERILYSNSN